MTPNVLIIAGMHRSGTTLTARWLHGCGLFLGDELLESKYDHANPDGNHYEDLEFLRLHKRILLANGYNAEGYLTDEDLTIDAHFYRSAQAIILQRDQSHTQWGWKEPRTCLLMDFWHASLPDAYTLVVYRHYERVADSLLRRKLDHPKRLRRWFYQIRFHDKQAHAAHYIAVWNRYNKELLHAIEQSLEKTLVVHISDIITRSDDIIAYMNQQWGFNLDVQSANVIFEKKRLRQEARYVDMSHPQVSVVAQDAQVTYDQLQVWRELGLRRFD